MGNYLGLDTSNYTTSAAVYQNELRQMVHYKKPLPVRQGFLGLRQSDAVFEQVRQLPEVITAVLGQTDKELTAVGASARPRDDEDSYMPCFLVGKTVGFSIAKSHQIPFYTFSHQAGHIAAALFSCRQVALLKTPFLAFHGSGGTTDLILVCPDPRDILTTQPLGKSLDLHAGQVVDRVGKLLGLSFPAGQALERLALTSPRSFEDDPKSLPWTKEGDCSLSGLENKCAALFAGGSSREEVARFCLDSLARAFCAMTVYARQTYPAYPVVFAGGVLSNQLIADYLTRQLTESGPVYFAKPEFAADNAAGVALLTALKDGQNHEQ